MPKTKDINCIIFLLLVNIFVIFLFTMIWVLTVFQRALFNKVACCSEQLVLYKYSTILYVMMIILSILEKSHIDQLFVYVLGPIIYSSKNKQNFYRGIGNTKPCLESWPRSVFKNAVNTWGTSLILCRVSHHKLMPQWILTKLSPNKMEGHPPKI